MSVSQYGLCPRCGCGTLEVLQTHAFCAGCNYSPNFEEAHDVPAWAVNAVKKVEDEENALSETTMYGDLAEVEELLKKYPELSDNYLSENAGVQVGSESEAPL